MIRPAGHFLRLTMATSTKVVLVVAVLLVILMYWFSFHYMSAPAAFEAPKTARNRGNDPEPLDKTVEVLLALDLLLPPFYFSLSICFIFQKFFGLSEGLREGAGTMSDFLPFSTPSSAPFLCLTVFFPGSNRRGLQFCGYSSLGVAFEIESVASKLSGALPGGPRR